MQIKLRAKLSFDAKIYIILFKVYSRFDRTIFSYKQLKSIK